MTKLALAHRRPALAAALLTLAFAAPGAFADPSDSEGTPEALRGGEPQTYAYQTLDYPGASQTVFWGRDDHGDLAGQYALAGGVPHAMVVRDGKFQALAPNQLGTYFSAAGGPTPEGATYGGYADASGKQHGFLIRRGRFETIDFRGHLNSNIDAADDCGHVLGVYWDADGLHHGMLSHDGNETPFDVDGARETYPLGMNRAGDSVGYWDADGRVTHGYLRHANGQVDPLDVPGAASTVAFAVNDRGQVAGYYADAKGALHGFVRTGQLVQQLDVPTGVATIVTALDNRGSVAGEYFDATGVRHGFVATLK